MKTYGTISLQCNEAGAAVWSIVCEPHVAMRLRRYFAKADRSGGAVKLHDTPEVCFDLRWFLERYPMHASPQDRDALDRRATAHAEKTEAFDLILSGKLEPRQFGLALPPRKYQAIAAELWLQAGGILVADELGLGKTLVAIAGLADRRLRPALVVVPTHLQIQWQREIKRFLPEATTHILKQGTPYNVEVNGAFPDVLISTYFKLHGWADALSPVIHSVVFDECQELRRSDSSKYQAAKRIADNAEYRLGLSATPIYNYGGEIFNVMQVIHPNALGTFDEFINEWCRKYMISNNRIIIDNPQAFGTYMRDQGLMLRRTRTSVGREIPPLSKVPFHVHADTRKLDEISDSVAELARIILAQGGDPLAKGQASREIDWKLRQATGIAKAPSVADFVKMLLESEPKIVLFGWHRAVYDIWMDALKQYNPVLYTGSESPTQKDRAVTRFIAPWGGMKSDCRVIIVSLRSGSGLDGLQHVCKTGVVGELDWSPGVHEQSEGRIFRDGQREPVVMYYAVSDAGSDPVVADVLRLKQSQVDGLRNPERSLVERLQVDPKHIENLARHYLESIGEVTH